MQKIVGQNIDLAALEKEHCRMLFEAFEYDWEAPTEPFDIGHSLSCSDDWFEAIKEHQGKDAVRLGIFLKDGTVIGDIALQGIDWRNRSCSLGLGLHRIRHRNQGYGSEATQLLLDYAFRHLGLERISANTLEINRAAQKALQKAGFMLEGRERKAVYFTGKRLDRLNFGLLAEDFAASLE